MKKYLYVNLILWVSRTHIYVWLLSCALVYTDFKWSNTWLLVQPVCTLKCPCLECFTLFVYAYKCGIFV